MTSPDLTHAFGPPATASLRGLLPPRDGAGRWPRPPEPRRPPDDADHSEGAGHSYTEDAEEADATEDLDARDGGFDDGFDDGSDDGFLDAEPTDHGPGAPGPAGTAAVREGPHGGDAPTRRGPAPAPVVGKDRPRGRARVVNRDHAELLVLLSLRQGPADGRAVITRLRQTDGHLDVGEQTVYVTLHRLARNRLLGRVLDPGSGRRLYALTEAGERAAGARLRDWHALTRGVDAVVRAGD